MGLLHGMTCQDHEWVETRLRLLTVSLFMLDIKRSVGLKQHFALASNDAVLHRRGGKWH